MEKNSCILNPSFRKDYPVIASGKGIYMVDEQGREYIDGSSGAVLVSLGHGRQDMADTLKAQAERISFAYRWDCITEVLESACHGVCEASDGHFSKVFFVCGGSEGTEIAIKLARRYFIDKGKPGKYKVISRWQSYHGSTMGVLSVTGFLARKRGYEPYLTDQGRIPPAYCYRCWYGKEAGKCNFECAQALENEILCQGADSIAAFIMEPVSGMSLCGAHPANGYYQIIREICDKYNVLLIDDEVMAGMGRTGSYYAYQQLGFKPDIVALGKALAGGYFPIGAVACTPKIYDTILAGSAEFPPGYSWAGNPLGSAVVAKTFEVLKQEQLVPQAAKRGEYLKKRLTEMAAKHPTVGDVRGLGLMVGLEFVQDKATKQTFAPELRYSRQVSTAALKHGMFLEASTGCDRGAYGDMVMVAPAFIVTEAEIDRIVDILDAAITDVEKANGCTGSAPAAGRPEE